MSEKASAQNNSRLSSPARTEAFSDGVFAIVITLLVLEIHRPHAEPGHLAAELCNAWPSYLAYAIAFLYVGIIWLNHHAVFRYLQAMDLTLNWMNLGGLSLVILIPFPTGVIADAFRSGTLADQKTAVVLYALVTGGMALAWLPVFPYLAKHPELLKPGVSPQMVRAQFSRPVVGVISYTVAALAGWFIHPVVAVVMFAFMVIYHALTIEGVRKVK